ncbi:MAG: methylglyoxal synthase [Bacteroidales bacterium]|nr:methylglyoxal synthase [Bacteroidales bacterium]
MIKNIAFVAHDARKVELVEWVAKNAQLLIGNELYCTGTTGRLITEALANALGNRSPHVNCLLSGPLGGDAQIGAMIAEGRIDMLIFFCDNLIMQGHQNDIQGLVRLASLYNIPFATNVSTADFLFASSLFKEPFYQHQLPRCIENYRTRQLNKE